ncbi:hypothetical protein C8F01DRAFT_1255100 [Mycena amicta]|nr:hypothetical protein C8F01DRAFT_1255100 [Mycena amicta]
MQFNILSAFILASVAFGSVRAAAVDPRALLDPGSSCTQWGIVPNTVNVNALCQDLAGVEHPTSVSLGNCLQNNNGTLGCGVGGNVDSTCVFSDLFQSGSNVFISSICTTSSGGKITNANDDFVLSGCLTNNNGVLGC